jgi:hypothetical protein
MPSEVVPGDSTDPAHEAAAVVAPPAWDLVVEEGASEAVVAAAAGADSGPDRGKKVTGA